MRDKLLLYLVFCHSIGGILDMLPWYRIQVWWCGVSTVGELCCMWGTAVGDQFALLGGKGLVCFGMG